MPISESATMARCTAGCIATAGKRGSANRKKPYVPILRSTPASSTDPAVGASTWASGSQVWNGNIGTLIANARKNAPNSPNATDPSPPMCAVRCAYANEYTPVRWPTRYTSARIATSMSSEPKKEDQRDQERGEQDHEQRDPVHAHRVADPPARDPRHVHDALHAVRRRERPPQRHRNREFDEARGERDVLGPARRSQHHDERGP